jgi:hypothetical protein
VNGGSLGASITVLQDELDDTAGLDEMLFVKEIVDVKKHIVAAGRRSDEPISFDRVEPNNFMNNCTHHEPIRLQDLQRTATSCQLLNRAGAEYQRASDNTDDVRSADLITWGWK